MTCLAEKKAKKKKGITKTGLTCLVFCIALMGATFAYIVAQAGEYNELRAEQERIQGLIAQEERINQNLELQISVFDRYAYIEQVARERLGMARPNEIVFRNIAAE